MKKIPVIVQVIGVSVLIFLFDLFIASESDGSLLIALLFWAGIGQGVIALSAAADLSEGKWIKPIRPYLQQYYPLLALFPIVFLIFTRHMVIYPWTGNPGSWLNTSFFIVRNVTVYMIPFICAHFYVRASQKESGKTGVWAVIYLISFITCQSFMAFDQVMTLEHPWVNTLFGGYFFVESLYAGIAFSILVSGILALKDPVRFKSSFNDFTIMLMGFALLWAGLFYSQYLVIWYGNLPEEVSYIEKRVSIPIISYMGIYIILALFLIPFLGLVSRKVKARIPFVSVIACIVFSGLIVERVIYLLPVVGLSIGGVVGFLVLLGIPFIYSLTGRSEG